MTFNPTSFGTTLLLRRALFETTTAREASAADGNRTVVCSNAALVTITIPLNLPVGWACMYYSAGAGGLTVDVSAVTETAGANNTIDQGEGIYVECVAGGTVILVGGTS